MQRVELEDPSGPPPDAPTDVPDGGDPPARGRRRTRARVAAGAALVVAGLVAAQAVLDARERAAVEALQQVAGVVAPVGDELDEAWSATLGAGMLVVDGRLVVLGVTDGSPRLTARSPDDGTVVWSAPLDVPREAAEGGLPGAACQPARTSAWGPLVVCLETDALQTWTDEGDTTVTPATRARVVVRAAADGTELLRRDVDLAVQGALVLDDVLVTVQGGEGTAVVRGHRLADVEAETDAAAWRTAWERTLRADDEPEGASGPFGLSSVGGVVLVTTSLGPQVGALTADGDLLPGTYDGGYAGEGEVLGLMTTTGTTLRSTIVRDGEAVVTVDGMPMLGSVDDGSLGDVVLTDHRTLTLWSVATGEAVWSAPDSVLGESPPGYGAPSVLGAMVVRGTVYAWGGDDVLALDGRDGTLRWSRESAGSDVFAVATDGRRLLVVSAVDDSAGGWMRVDALGFDGEDQGRVGLPRGIDWVLAYEGRLWGVRAPDPGTRELVALR